MLVTVDDVPVPKVKPAAPYSIFHDGSVPPGVHEKSAPADVKLLTITLVGLGHVGAFLISKLSIAISPQY